MRIFTARIHHLSWRVIALSCACLAPIAAAQLGDLGENVRRAPAITPDQTQAIADYVRRNSGNLGGDDPLLIRRDRAALLSPLLDSAATVPFRLEYARALLPVVEPLTSHENEIVAINALVIVGEVATAQSVDVVMRALASPRPSVRYQAAYAIRRTFETLAALPAPTIRDDQAADALRRSAARLIAEEDALVADALTLALLQAGKRNEYRSQALAALSGAVSARAKSLSTAAPEEGVQVLMRAAVGVRDALAGARTGQLSAEAIRQAAEMGGNIIAYCARAVQTRSLPMAERGKPEFAAREAHSSMATTGENIVLLAVQLQGTTPPAAKGIGDRLRTSTQTADAGFVEDARSIVGRGGLLSREPFRFADTHFMGN
jgi:hypothetical protein